MRWMAGLLLPILLVSCNGKEMIPDVSGIRINLTTRHFEKDLFNPDTSGFAARLDQLQASYPSFGENFLTTILNCDPKWTVDSTARYVLSFVNAYRPMYDSAEKLYSDFTPYESQIRHGLQFLKYYFPEYRIPEKIITYIGPLDGFGDIISDDAIIVGLHHHLGENFPLYQSSLVQETYPEYISRRFAPGYIALNALKNIVLDLYPENIEDRPLVLQMVEKGKRLWLLSKLMPFTEEYKLIGYTKEQLADTYGHEKAVWDLFLQNNFLQTTDAGIIKNYIGDGPKTPELGEAAPGNIGSFSGWQIVKKFMQKNPKLTPKELMAKDAGALFEEARYNP